MPDMEPNSMEHYYQDDEYPEEVFSVCAVPGNSKINFILENFYTKFH